MKSVYLFRANWKSLQGWYTFTTLLLTFTIFQYLPFWNQNFSSDIFSRPKFETPNFEDLDSCDYAETMVVR